MAEVAEKSLDAKTPPIRFSEFSSCWEKKLLENISKRGSGHTPNKQQKDYYNGGIKWVSLGDSHRLDNGFIYDTKIKVSQKGIENSSAVLHPAGTVILSRDAGVGKSAILKHSMAVSQHFITWKTNENELDNWFLYYKLQILKREFERIAIGSTIKTIGLPYFKKLKITVPPYEEQKKIASFLSAVDNQIKLLEQKKSKLEEYKKGVMQKIFSREIRFKPQFEDLDLPPGTVTDLAAHFPDWEEVKLDDIGETYTGLSGKTKEDFGLGKPYVQYKQIFDRSYIDTSKCDLVEISESDNQCKVQYGDVFFTTSSETPNEICTSSVLLDKVDEMYLNSFCFGYRPNTEILKPEFARFLFRAQNFRSKVVRLAQGSTRYNISKRAFLKLKIVLPCIEEQNKIAAFLTSIDKKIEGIEKAIEGSKKFKKGLLQQMFV